jgi:tetratricopeptide (TPR) repeat protein
MNKKRTFILSISGVAICLALLFFTIKIFQDGSYRNQLPGYPDFQTIQKSLKEQILLAGRKAYLNPTSDNLGYLGMVYYSSAYYEKAVQCYQLAVKKDSAKWIWSYYLGYLNLELGESNASVVNFGHVIQDDPKNILALFYIAEAYQNLGLSLNAKSIFKRIAALNDHNFIKSEVIRENDFPLQTYALFRLARIYMNSNLSDSAETTLKEIIKNQIAFGPAYRLLGTVYTNMGNLTLGTKYTVRANDLLDYTPPADMLVDKIALMSRSDTYLLKQIDDAIRSNNYHWALKLCEHGLKYNPDNKFLISNIIFEYFTLGYDKKALLYLDQHIKYFSDDFNELMHLADILFDKGYDVQALKYFTQAKKLEPGNTRLVLWLSDKNMPDQAVNLLNEQLKNDPGNFNIVSLAVNLYMYLGENEKAITYLASLKRLKPSGPDVKKLEGLAAEKDGKLKEALTCYEEALKDDPKDLNMIKYLASAYIQSKLWDKAIRHYRLALDIYPNEPNLLEGFGQLLISCPELNLRNVQEAREYSERAFISFKSPYTTKVFAGRDLATAYAMLGDKQKASKFINLTIDMAREKNVPLNYAYFETLKKQYNISN